MPDREALSDQGACNCIMAAHCDPSRTGYCRLNAGGSVNAGGGVCGPSPRSLLRKRAVQDPVEFAHDFAQLEAERDRLRAENAILEGMRQEVFDALEGKAVPDQGVAHDVAALRAEVERLQDMVQDWRERATNHELEVGRLRDCLDAAGAKFHELDLPVYADACLRESRGATDEQEATG